MLFLHSVTDFHQLHQLQNGPAEDLISALQRDEFLFEALPNPLYKMFLWEEGDALLHYLFPQNDNQLTDEPGTLREQIRRYAEDPENTMWKGLPLWLNSGPMSEGSEYQWHQRLDDIMLQITAGISEIEAGL
ncbi:hypothetical protein P154DRAFT_305881 [Amniculicola lignicola CBS 123094]|uniref:Uncharacterized protein n=1 Tax=Amniculicola lignicola CBS 123094 TaxID=1392246 RepID=A0A6A5W604_9PLEO|nr:hypothetical protein P154DRAFT_305881 [Amniculicola lignicola CBS 123094]